MHVSLDHHVVQTGIAVNWTLVARLLVILALVPYLAVPVYRWPASQPFSGSQWWNPYENATGPWRRANFHAHGQSWGGLTAGAQSDGDVVRAYRAAGYDIAGVSNYESVSSVDLVPAYEHGYNLNKHHQLALGAHAVVWWDFPLWQGINEKQFVLDRLRVWTDVIALNHPARRHGYTVEDVRRLTGYQLMEIANGRITTDDRWDAALSSGRPVLGIGGDDTHDVNDDRRFAVAWTMIAAPALTSQAVLDALRGGRSYVVVRKRSDPVAPELSLASLTVEGPSLEVRLAGPESLITFVGQDGTVRQTTKGTMACYRFSAADTYIRTMVQGEDADLYLNPVMRSAGGPPVWPKASADAWWTALRQAAIVTVCLFLAVPRWPGRKRQPG
jgi:hypothetical protein